MNNPYQILNVHQDADKKEIMSSQILAMKEKKHSLQEIQMAVRKLLDPAKRLAADFMFPSKLKVKRAQTISTDEIQVPNIHLNDIDENAFDSLK